VQMMKRKAFTLVELLVVIGIIAVLVGILLPALAKARDQANTIKCASNLRGIGQAFAQYLTENKDTFPPSNFFTGLQVNTANQTQAPTQPIYGYTHWSALISGTAQWENASGYITTSAAPVMTAAQLAPFLNTKGWEQFQCPALLNGGLPPDNTYPSNHDLGLQNDAGPNIVDLQAPRLAYTVNEALCPRSYLVAHIPGINNVHGYNFVRSGRIQHSAETILGAELWGFQADAMTTSQINGNFISNSRRPVSGYISFGTTPDKLYNSLTGIYTAVADGYENQMSPNPEPGFEAAVAAGGLPNPNTTLDFVGRNHGAHSFGMVGGDTRTGWDLRTTNFLFVDGHVETKNVADTVYPKNQWGDEMYSLQQN